MIVHAPEAVKLSASTQISASGKSQMDSCASVKEKRLAGAIQMVNVSMILSFLGPQPNITLFDTYTVPLGIWHVCS